MIVETLFNEIQRGMKDDVPSFGEEAFKVFLNKAVRHTAYDSDFFWKYMTKAGAVDTVKYQLDNLNIIELVHVFYGEKQLNSLFMSEPFHDTTSATPKRYDLLWDNNIPYLFIAPPPDEADTIHIYYKDIPYQVTRLKEQIPLPSYLWKAVELLTHHFVSKIYERADSQQYKLEYLAEMERQNMLHAESEVIRGVKGDLVFVEQQVIS